MLKSYYFEISGGIFTFWVPLDWFSDVYLVKKKKKKDDLLVQTCLVPTFTIDS